MEFEMSERIFSGEECRTIFMVNECRVVDSLFYFLEKL